MADFLPSSPSSPSSSSSLSVASSWPSSELRLAALDPLTTEIPAYLSAVVTLMWPFSYSSSSLSITVSEEDFRLRSNKGQLRVNFNGPCARAVEACGLQIGDRVMISLEGACYEELVNKTGMDVPWALTFTSRLVMKTKTTAGWSTININRPITADVTELVASTELEAVKEKEFPSSSHPATPPVAEPFSFSKNDNEWTTPDLFKRRLTLIPDGLGSALAIGEQGLFDEEDEYNLEHRRKRVRFSSNYRLLDGDESMEKSMENENENEGQQITVGGSAAPGHKFQEGAVGVNRCGEDSLEVVFAEQSSPGTLIGIPDSMDLSLPGVSKHPDHPSHITMPPPPLPTQFSETVPDSPSLKPVPSEQLPMVSPFLNHGLAEADYMDSVPYSSLPASEAEVVMDTMTSPAIATQKVGVKLQYDTALIPQAASVEVGIGGGDGAIDSDDDFEKEFAAGPQVFVIPEEVVTTTTAVTVGFSVTSPTGPTISQLLAAQRLPSPSDDDRLPSSYDSDKDSLFDDSETETRHRLSRRTLGRSPLRTAESTTPRRSVPYTKPSRLNLETPSIAFPGPISAGLAEAMPGPPRTPFLYLPTPSPVVEKQLIGFPKSAPPQFRASYITPAVEDRGSPLVRPSVGSSPIRRKGNFWRQSREPPSSDLSAYFGRPKRVTDISPQTEVLASDNDNDTGASNTEEELSSFSTPNAGTDQEEEDDDNVEKELEKELEGGFKSGVTTNLSDFPSLSSLVWDAVVDIIGVVSWFKPAKRAQGGQMDWYISLRVVDSSLTEGITATILRPYKEALPIVDVGDVMLLRSFRISSHRRNFVATSTTNSAWATWKENGKGRPVHISGPPVEYGDQEERYVENIGAWYADLDTDRRVEMERDRGEGDYLER